MISDIKYSVDADGILIDQKPTYNKMMNSDLALQLDEKFVADRVKKLALGPEGKIVERYNANPILKYIIYELEFPDVQVEDYTVNVIAENILSQVDE